MTGGLKSGTGMFMDRQNAYRKFTPEEETKFKNKLVAADPIPAAVTTKKKKKPTDTIAASTKLTG